MRYFELIQKYVWPNIEPTFEQLYPDQLSNTEKYAAIFEEIKHLTPKECNIKINIEYTHEPGEHDEILKVSGTHLNNPVNKVRFALEFRPWEEWLGMSFDDLTWEHFTHYEIISHCLYEMTFLGFDQETIQKEWQAIKDISDEIDNMSEMEAKEKFVSWDEFKDDISFMTPPANDVSFGEN